jgi:hypothetical protein
MVAPTQNLLAKNMLTHIGIALALGGYVTHSTSTLFPILPLIDKRQ